MPAKKITRAEKIKRKLKSAQVAKGLTAEKVGKLMGVTGTAVTRWYGDINRLGVLDFELLCSVLGIEPSEIHEIK